jgi:hypothetical protein
MRWRRDRDREAAQHGHAALETKKLQRDLALIVIHAEHRVVIAPPRFDPDRVGREWPFGMVAAFARLLDGRRDHIDLFASEQSAFPRMRIIS